MTDIYKTLMALGQGGQPQVPMMQQQQPNQMGMQNMQGMMPQMQRGQQAGPQFQQPSWLDLFNQTMMMGSMMPQQMPSNMYGYGMNPNNQQAAPSAWQKGFQGVGTTLSGLSNPLTSAGVAGSSFAQPWGPLALGGGIAAGGLGSLFNYLGQPGVQQ